MLFRPFQTVWSLSPRRDIVQDAGEPLYNVHYVVNSGLTTSGTWTTLFSFRAKHCYIMSYLLHGSKTTTRLHFAYAFPHHVYKVHSADNLLKFSGGQLHCNWLKCAPSCTYIPRNFCRLDWFNYVFTRNVNTTRNLFNLVEFNTAVFLV